MPNGDSKETAVHLSVARVTIFEGPGRDWAMVIDGTRGRRHARNGAAKSNQQSAQKRRPK